MLAFITSFLFKFQLFRFPYQRIELMHLQTGDLLDLSYKQQGEHMRSVENQRIAQGRLQRDRARWRGDGNTPLKEHLSALIVHLSKPLKLIPRSFSCSRSSSPTTFSSCFFDSKSSDQCLRALHCMYHCKWHAQGYLRRERANSTKFVLYKVVKLT